MNGLLFVFGAWLLAGYGVNDVLGKSVDDRDTRVVPSKVKSLEEETSHGVNSGAQHVESQTAYTRVIDGVATPPNRLQWNVALDTVDFGFICGGSLIDMFWVLTASHCVYGATENNVTIFALVGAWNLSTSDEADNVTVVEIIHYPAYAWNQTSENDVALLRLERAVAINDTKRFIIELPDPLFNVFALNPHCLITGWGATDSDDTRTMSPVLTMRQVAVITHVECQIRWDQAATQPSVYSSNICIDEGLTGDISACYGDSGSPLQCYDSEDNVWRIAGVSSWGSGACTTYPSVYMRIQTFLPWIKHHINLSRRRRARESQQQVGITG